MNEQLFFSEIVPNIYWVYHYTSISFQTAHKDFITKVCQNHGVKELIKIDSNCTFWKRYDMSNKVEEFRLLDQLIENITQKIVFNYNNRIPTLIVSIINNDIALVGIIHFFHFATKLGKDAILDALRFKIANIPDIGAKVGEYLKIG